MTAAIGATQKLVSDAETRAQAADARARETEVAAEAKRREADAYAKDTKDKATLVFADPSCP